MTRTTMSSVQRYDRVSVALHWTIAIGIFVLGGVELFRHEFPKGHFIREGLKAIHQPAGTVLFLLILVRLAWTATFQRKPIDAGHGKLQTGMAKLVHLGLYVLMISVPLAGLVSVFAGGKSVDFGLFQLVAPLNASIAGYTRSLREVHEFLALSILALGLMHAAAALVHHYALGDNVLWSMFVHPRRNRNSVAAADNDRHSLVA